MKTSPTKKAIQVGDVVIRGLLVDAAAIGSFESNDYESLTSNSMTDITTYESHIDPRKLNLMPKEFLTRETMVKKFKTPDGHMNLLAHMCTSRELFEAAARKHKMEPKDFVDKFFQPIDFAVPLRIDNALSLPTPAALMMCSKTLDLLPKEWLQDILVAEVLADRAEEDRSMAQVQTLNFLLRVSDGDSAMDYNIDELEVELDDRSEAVGRSGWRTGSSGITYGDSWDLEYTKSVFGSRLLATALDKASDVALSAEDVGKRGLKRVMNEIGMDA